MFCIYLLLDTGFWHSCREQNTDEITGKQAIKASDIHWLSHFLQHLTIINTLILALQMISLLNYLRKICSL